LGGPHVDHRDAGVLIIAMMVHAIEGDQEALLAAGMNDYISKPFSLIQLTALADAWRERLRQPGYIAR
jgi:two-component system, sensor histidine kinase and response regulator